MLDLAQTLKDKKLKLSNVRVRNTFFTRVFALVEALVDNADVKICLDLVLASDIVGEVHNFLVAE